MTKKELREHYAGLAMQSLLALDPAEHITPMHTARTAVLYADALLEAVYTCSCNSYVRMSSGDGKIVNRCTDCLKEWGSK